MFPNRLEIGVDHDPHVWPLEEIIGIQPSHHRGHKCVQIRFLFLNFLIILLTSIRICYLVLVYKGFSARRVES